MKLLVVITSDSLMRFVGPVLAKLHRNISVTIVGPDITSLPEIRYSSEQPVQCIDRATRVMRKIRSVLTYLYWVFLDVQSQYLLKLMYDKAIRLLDLPSRYRFAEGFIRSMSRCARILRWAKLNRYVARAWLAGFRLLETWTGPDKHIVSQIKEIDPDVILHCPGLYPHHFDIDYAKAGIRMGIPTLTLIQSWDTLTKGLFSVIPDRVMIWNEVQRQELIEYHALSPERAILVGSPCFDRMFEARFMQPLEVFCQQARLDPERPFVLWAATSVGTSGSDPVIVRRFIYEMRRTPALAKYQVLVRPHPNYPKLWDSWNVPDAPVWSSPCLPISDEEIRGLYNAIAHSVAVVGLSTSLFMEAAILDRPCAMIKKPESVETPLHDRYIHYRYLIDQGFPEATENEVDCARWLANLVAGQDPGRKARQECVSSFLRPGGLDRPSAEVAADAIADAMMKEATGLLPEGATFGR